MQHALLNEFEPRFYTLPQPALPLKEMPEGPRFLERSPKGSAGT